MKIMIKLRAFNPQHLRKCCRCIFSKTGAWDSEVSLEAKLEIEDYWRTSVQSTDVPDAAKKPKHYVLAMFPYPSGSLHMGHARVYTISDTIARFHCMNGKNVIHPMGWDAFGLPAENAAKERGVDPEAWTKDNIEAMRTQLLRLGLCLDWNREINTSSPEYYAGTQRIFLELWKAGLVYQDQAVVNWDPVDQTVLADEQVDSKGHSWRSGAKVERRLLTQWFIKTTKFARQLLNGLDSPLLQDWRDIIQLQKHWIGSCDGTFLTFSLSQPPSSTLKVWTRCPEEAGLFVAVSRRHSLNSPENQISQQPCPETAVILKQTARNPLHGNTLPLVACDMEENKNDDCGYLVVASSETDSELAAKFGLTSSQVSSITREEAFIKARHLGVGGDAVSSHLRDWLISRQRRWGTPIPVVKCSTCGCQPVPDSDLPVILPKPDLSLDQWKSTQCPKCGGAAERETDTMDTFVDSSWYFLRFLDPHNEKLPFDPVKVAPDMPVDLYVGGKEHAVLHLYYARFMSHFLHHIGWVPEPEPFRRLLVQGMVMGKSYQVRSSGKYLSPEQVDTSGPKLVEKETGEQVVECWEKMSKSKYNGVDPNAVLTELGCDATRLLLLADVAPTSHRKWSSDTYPGILGWQHRLWLTVRDFMTVRTLMPEISAPSAEELAQEEERLWDSRNFYICGTTFNFCNSQQLSVAVTKMQGLTNSLRRTPKPVMVRSQQFERALAAQIVMLAPMAPHFASELWAGFTSAKPMLSSDFDWEKPVLQQRWPKLDKEYKLNLNIQLNHRDVMSVKVPQSAQTDLTVAEALELALGQEEVVKAMGVFVVRDTTLEVKPDYEINLNIATDKPEGYEKMPKQEKRKKKKNRAA